MLSEGPGRRSEQPVRQTLCDGHPGPEVRDGGTKDNSADLC